ncbi:MAG TPA: asparagine synthetase B, partial [Ignavibacteria bacterium]|nr:asparagine synthetase B [Ignavibacteria bacterium]
MKQFILLLLIVIGGTVYSQQKLLIPMDVNSQTDHLRAYGIAYRHLLGGRELDWLLNYRGGSFLFDYSGELAAECT